MRRSSSVSPWSSRSRNSTVLWASASSLSACMSGSRAPMGSTSSASRLTFLPSPARRTFVNTLMSHPSYRPRGPRRRHAGHNVGSGCVRLTWSLTPHSPAARVTRRPRRPGVATGPNGTVLTRVASSPPAPDSRGRGGQGLPLSRTMLSDHKSPYVGRFACGWPRLSTTDPHAARVHVRPGRPDGPPGPLRGTDYCPGTVEFAEPEGLPVLPGVAPSSTVTPEIFQTPSTRCRSAMRRTTSAWGVVILVFT